MTALSLPLFPGLTSANQQMVVNVLTDQLRALSLEKLA